MTRTPDEATRRALVDKAVDYVCAHGLSDLSLRPLAQAIDTSPSLLLYHFGSKEALLAAVLKAGRARQHAMMRQMETEGLSERRAARRLWKVWSSPAWQPLTRVFFEVFALALRAPKRFPGFLDEAVSDWLHALDEGRGTAASRARATLMIATFRGLLLDLMATGDRARVDKAAEMFFQTLNDTRETGGHASR
jgi:AcrR family transcriptional regulator